MKRHTLLPLVLTLAPALLFVGCEKDGAETEVPTATDGGLDSGAKAPGVIDASADDDDADDGDDGDADDDVDSMEEDIEEALDEDDDE